MLEGDDIVGWNSYYENTVIPCRDFPENWEELENITIVPDGTSMDDFEKYGRVYPENL